MKIEGVVVGVAAPDPIHYADEDLTFTPLGGVDHDVRAFTQMLEGARNEIRQVHVDVRLEAARTTVLSVKGAMRAAATSCRAGDLLVVVMCGHGFQRPDRDVIQEPDGLDEVFACSNGPLDDDFFPTLWGELDPDASALVIVDACSADTYGLAVRELELDEVYVPEVERSWSAAPSRIALAACQSWERALEGGDDSPGRGVFSFHLQRALADGPSSYLDWYRRTVQTMGQQQYVQRPSMRYVGPESRGTFVEQLPFSC